MNTRKYMILINDQDITSDVTYCRYNPQTKKYDVTYKNQKVYSYHYSNITWLKEPDVIDPASVHISHGERELFDIQAIYVFQAIHTNYWHICFSNGSERTYNEQELHIEKSCLNHALTRNSFDYMRQLAKINDLHSEDGTILLEKQYENINFIGNHAAAAVYLNPAENEVALYPDGYPVFPFGCNESQYLAVEAALTHQISVIQGPPGTGKTQTILNIIANLLIQGKTILVVSNNNSATANVMEKLSSPKYGLGFLVAPLGNSDHKSDFIGDQSGVYPNLSSWKISDEAQMSLQKKVEEFSAELTRIFKKQQRLAKAKQEWEALQIEQKYFQQYCMDTFDLEEIPKGPGRLKSDQLMQLWQECYDFSERKQKVSLWFKIKIVLLYRITNWNFFYYDFSKIVTMMQALFYKAKNAELTEEISFLEGELKAAETDKKLDNLTAMSLRFLRGKLYVKYGGKNGRRKFTQDDLWKNSKEVAAEYPVILSTTFSSRSSLGKNMIYDYIIMDEASQVDVATGTLALTCARNAVIVGDTKQLPNVLPDDLKRRADAILESFHIDSGYSFTENSFLKSVCRVLPDVPQTMLREHYRCHPKIIGFCNQKFYHNELIVMTEDHGESDVLSLFRTVTGNHRRDHLNQRQIDVVCQEALPQLKKLGAEDIGIIAPYNDQVQAFKKQLGSDEMDVATVHKFQGREKDTIILTTVDDVVTEFSDDPYLLNVAISRAKRRLCLVVSGNEQPADSNLNDLIAYIQYNNMEITQSKIYSVFDYLYQQYTSGRLAYLKKHKRISEYDSENLMYGLIQDVLSNRSCTALDVIFHQPLNMLIRDPKLLSQTECKYAMNAATHLDFLIYNKISKKPILAIEVDGFHHHKEGTLQARRDQMKNHILDLYGISYLRFPTNGSGEKEKLEQALDEYENGFHTNSTE